MHFLCIISCAFLMATVNAKSSTSNPTNDDDPYGYYDDPVEDSVPPDQSDDASLPPRFLIGPEVVVAKEGESAILKCPTENAEYYGSMWLKEKETITQGSLSLNNDLYGVFKNNSLIIKHIKPASIGYYTCVIAISAKENISLTHRLKLENAAEIVSLRAQNNVTQLYTGDTLTLTCEVDGKPMPTIKWFFDRNGEDGANELHIGNHQSTGYRDTLIIKDVNNKHNGTYRCFADNKITADHQSIVIEIYDTLIHVDITKHYVKNNKLKFLECTVRLNRHQIDYLSWSKENGYIVNSFEEETDRSSILSFEDMQDVHFGNYICTVKKGDSTANKTIIVQPPTKPTFKKFLSSDVDKYNITLVWGVLSYDPIINCFVYDATQNEYEPIPYVFVEINGEDSDNYLLSHSHFLHFNVIYGFKIHCQNSVGWSQKSDVQHFELTDDHVYIEIQKLHNTSDLIGLNCLLLLNATEVSLFWKKDTAVHGDSISHATLEYANTSLALIFRDTSFMNVGTYICIANITSNRFLQKHIHIQPPSTPTAVRNSSLIIVWNVNSILPITECKVQYGKAFGPLEELDRKAIIAREVFYNYVVSYVPPQFLKGQYEFLLTCKNEDGWSERSEMQLIQLGVAPTVRIEKIYSSGKTVTGLNCIAESNPLPNIFWKKDGEIINNNSTLRRTKYSLKIMFEHVDETDFGKYTCVAKNFVDSAEKSVIFIKPLQPQFRGFEPLGNKRDILSWTVISQEPIKSCVVYYKGENETRQAIAATEIVRYKDGYLITHSPLVPTDGTYKFRVKCLGEGGWSDESQERSLGIKGKGRDSATSDSQTSAGLRLVPTIMLFIATAVLMNP